MSTVITINGKRIEVPEGANVSVTNGQVNINSVAGDMIGNVGSFDGGTIIIEGNVGNVRADRASIEIKGSVTGDVDAGGSITCGNVGGTADAGGSITCLNVEGDVDAGGSIRCGTVKGNIDAGGSVRHG